VVTGPRGGKAVVGKGPAGGKGVAFKGPGGARGGAYKGPRGGAGAVVGKPGKGVVGGVRGPHGGAAVRARVPGYGSAGAVRGPYGNTAAVRRLPDGSTRVRVNGRDYYRYHYGGYPYYYHPYHDHGDVYYYPIYPPTGVWITTLPDGYVVRVIGGRTYYIYNETYYAYEVKNNRAGYTVVNAPASVVKQAEVPDPYVVLKRMSDYMALQKTFSAQATVSCDETLDTGMKICLSGKRQVYVNRPNQLKAELVGDEENKLAVYDGKKMTILDRSNNMYSEVAVPETIDKAFDTLATEYGMTMPLADLLYSDSYKVLSERTETGQYLGLHKVGKHDCHHLIFAQENVDWEIWILAGKMPLPRKIMVRYKKQPGSPRFTVILGNYNLSRTYSPGFFNFRPPANAQKIDMLPVAQR
jgi:hypothetical protein